jgi:hypothetical protein
MEITPDMLTPDLIAAWCRMEAEQNDALCQHSMANMYFSGDPLERNILLAEQWNDRALANERDPDEMKSMKSMQMYMLAERLRRVKAVPILEGSQTFRYSGPILTVNCPDANASTHSYDLCCEGCSAMISIDARKKFCSGCNIAAYCCRTCQKADWKRHKKVCGKQPDETHHLRKVGKEKYKEALSVVYDYVQSVPGLVRYLQLLAYIHWNDTPLISVNTTADTDGMNPTVVVIPRIVWESKHHERDMLAKFYKDGPRKDAFFCVHSIKHLGPELAKKTEFDMTHVTMEQETSDPEFIFDLAVRMAKCIQNSDLVDVVRRRTTLPTSVDEMNAFYDFHMKMVNMQTDPMAARFARMRMNT